MRTIFHQRTFSQQVDTILPFVVEQNCNGTILAWNETDKNAEHPAPTITVRASTATASAAEVESSDAHVRSNTMVQVLSFTLLSVGVCIQL